MTIEFKSPIFQSDVSGIAVHWTSYQHISGLSGHAGLDFPMPDGTPIRASADGKIIRSFNNSDFGNLVVIDHGDQIHTLYAHMKNDGFVDSSGNLLNNASLSGDGKIVVNGQEVAGAKSIKDYLSVNYDDDTTNDVEINVNSGDVIGFVDDTGIGDTHLHFSILDLNETEAQSLGKKDGDSFGVFELPNSLIPWKDIDSDGDGTTRSDADYTNNRLAQYNAVLNLAPEIAALADHPNEVTNWEGRWDEGFTTFATLNPTDSSPDTALGSIERNGDKDWFRLETTDEHTYEITVSGASINGFQALSNPFFTVKKELNETPGIYENISEATADRTDMSGASETVTFTANGGDYYVVIGGGGDNFATERGGYSVAISDTTNAVDPTFPENGVDQTISFADAADNFGASDGSDVAALYLESIFGSAISNVTYTGSENAAFLVSDFEIPGVDIDLEGGILLSSGAWPGAANTSSEFTVEHGTAGDDDLFEVVTAAFPTAGSTEDAAILEFDIFIDNSDVEGIRFDIVFGSEEYSEYSSSDFVDVAAVWVDDDRDGDFEPDENKARFNGNANTPLSVIDDNLALNFVDNEGGNYAIEWDGFGTLAVRPELQQGLNSIKIAVADTGDQSLDSAIYVTNFELLTGGATGDDVFKTVNGVVGQNDLGATETKEEIKLADGAGSVSGTLAELSDDIITGFDSVKSLIFEAIEFLRSQLEVLSGSAILQIDSDQDGVADGSVTLEGDFSGGDFMAVRGNGETLVTFETFLPTLQEGQAIDPNLVNGIINQNYLKGDGSSDFQVTLRDMGFAGYNNVVGVYEIDASGNIVDTRILFGNANADKSAVAGITDVEAGNKLGFFLVQDAADWAATLADGDTLSFVNSSGAAANISDGSDISIAVNGASVDEMVFHSFSEDLNSDGVQHALSGVDVGGEAITVGFEDLTGGGDRDYEDVVFRVEVVDDFAFV